MLLFESFVLVSNHHLFVWIIQVVVVSVFHSCASTTHPFLLQNSTMFFKVTWSYSLEFWSTSWLKLSHSTIILLLPFNESLWDLHQFKLQCPFSQMVFFSLLERIFYPTGFSPFLRLWEFIHGYLIRLSCWDPSLFSFVSTLCFAYGGC